MEHEYDLSGKHLRKLNLYAPILSTKRPSDLVSARNSVNGRQQSSFDTSERVPFAWEEVPGTPKGLKKRARHTDVVPPPKPPPCKWHSHHEPKDICDSIGGDLGSRERFSDAVDTFSLAESYSDVNNTSQRAVNGKHVSPSFLIGRFLPDANALAFSRRESTETPFEVDYTSPSESQSISPPKACGIGFFFQWRMKNRLCGSKNPVRPQGHHNVRFKGKRNGV